MSICINIYLISRQHFYIDLIYWNINIGNRKCVECACAKSKVTRDNTQDNMNQLGKNKHIKLL